jgi:hypothetical protein
MGSSVFNDDPMIASAKLHRLLPRQWSSTSTGTATGCDRTAPGPKPPGEPWPAHHHHRPRTHVASRYRHDTLPQVPTPGHADRPAGLLRRRVPGGGDRRRRDATTTRLSSSPTPGPAGLSPSDDCDTCGERASGRVWRRRHTGRWMIFEGERQIPPRRDFR